MEFVCVTLLAAPVLLLIWLRSASNGDSRARYETNELADLTGTIRRLDDFRLAGVIDDAGCQRVRAYYDQRKRQLERGPAPRELAREPIPPPAPVAIAERPVAPLKPIVRPPTPAPVIAPPTEPTPVAPRRSMTEWLAAFMEERNVLWGELVGGLLVVGCSTALVLSLWQTLERIPLFPFLVMVGVTSALFGVGQYTLRKWRLESTSRGLLAIATLLVPLDFLVLAGLSPRSGSLWEWAIKLTAIPVFAWFIYRATRVLFSQSGRPAGWLTFAILGAAVSPLLMPRLLGSGEPAIGWVLALGAWPIACHVIGIGVLMHRYRRQAGREFADGVALLSMTALALVPLGLALGFLAYWIVSEGGDRASVLEQLAAFIGMSGVPTLVAALCVRQRVSGSTDERSGLLATTATGTALFGMLIMLTAFVLAWPQPVALLAVGVINFAVLAAVAHGFRLPPAHGFALLCLTAAYLAAYWLFAGAPLDLPRPELADWLIRQTFSIDGGTALVGLATLMALLADLLHSAKRRTDAACYAIAAAVIGSISLVLVSLEVVADPARTTWVAGWAACVCLLCGQRWQLLWLRQVGAVLIVCATTAGLHWLEPGRPALWGTMLAAEALLLCVRPGTGRFAAALAAAVAIILSVHDLAELRTGWPTITAVLLAAAAGLRATQARFAGWTWLGAGLLLAGIAHFLVVRSEPTPPLPYAASLLVYASLTFPAGLALRRLRRFELRRVLGRPVTQSSLLATLAVVPFLGLEIPNDRLPILTGYCAWLATLWLVAAIAFRSRGWFAAFQAATSATVVFGIAAYLAPTDFLAPSVLRRFMVGLAGLALVWATARRLSRSPLAHKLLESPFDPVVLGFLVVAFLSQAITLVAPAIATECRRAAASDVHWRAIEQALDPAAWFALGMLAVALSTELRNDSTLRLRAALLVGLVLIAATAPVLASGYFADELASASALRWGLALVFVFASIPIWLTYDPARTAALRTLVAIAAVPVLLLTIASGSMLALNRTGGPAAESMFAAMGAVFSHCLPLALIAAAFAGHALRERSAGFAFAGGLIANLVTTGGLAMHSAIAGVPFDESMLIQLLQSFSATASLWAIGWLWALGRPVSSTLWTQLALAAGVQFALLGVPAVTLIVRPGNFASPWIRLAGQSAGAMALIAAIVAWFGAATRSGPSWRSAVSGTSGVLAAVWLACAVADWDSGDWLAYHALAVGWAAAGGVALAFGRERRSFWVTAFAALLTLLAVRAAAADPLRPYAPALTALITSGLLGGLAVIERRAAFVSASGLLIVLSGLVFWLDWGPHTLPGFGATLAIGLSCAAVIWSLCDRPLSTDFRRSATAVSIALLGAFVASAIVAPIGAFAPITGPLTWAAYVATAFAVAGFARDRAAFIAPATYALGLIGALLALLELNLAGEPFLRALMLVLAAFVLVAQCTARYFRKLPGWLISAQIAIGVIAIMLSLGVSVVWGEPIARLCGPFAVILVLAACSFVASAQRSRVLASVTIGLGTLFVAEIGWAILDLDAGALALHRVVAVASALTFGTLVCSFGLARRLPAGTLWAETARRAGPVLGLLCAGALTVAVALEGASFDPVAKRTPLGPTAIALIAAAFLALMTAAIAFAVRPWTDPFGLSERRRPLYVYGTELLLVLLFLHLRFNVPGLFPPIRGQYWAFVVMAIAFVGVGLSEFLRRRRIDVVAGPLRRTGLFLPLLPLIVFWLNPPEAIRSAIVDWFPGAHPLLKYLDAIPRSFDAYASLWFLFGLLYLWLGITRRSFWYTIAAALAANVGLWALLHHGGIAFLAHPQLWLIPGALIILASEHHHRDALTEEASTGLRFAGLGILYLSSTADLFITGLGNSVLLPLVLMVLSVAGVLAGILFRVRSYMYMGAGFLGLVVFSMIWHAAVDRNQTWIWWASGVALGIAILALFAVFEKRRPQMLHALGKLRTWSA